MYRRPIRDAGPDPLLSAADRLLADLAQGRAPSPESFAAVAPALSRYVARRYPQLDADDVVQATLTRLVVAHDHGADLRPGSAWALLLSTTRYAALDALRARKRRHEVDLSAVAELPAPDDDISALIDAEADQSAIVEAMRACLEDGDALTAQVVTVWLDLADMDGDAPSTRRVAEFSGVSHTTVAACLRRFREIIIR